MNAVRGITEATLELQDIAARWFAMFNYDLSYGVDVGDDDIPLLKQCLAKQDDTEFKIFVQQQDDELGPHLTLR